MSEDGASSVERVVQAAHGEMAYEMTENHVMGHEYPVSIPCQLRFTDDTDQDIQRFHDALDVHGYTPVESSPGRDGVEPYYEGEVVSQDDYKRIKILVFRGGVVRIYPREDEPSEEELAEILHALSVGFKSPLEHDPIEREAEA